VYGLHFKFQELLCEAGPVWRACVGDHPGPMIEKGPEKVA